MKPKIPTSRPFAQESLISLLPPFIFGIAMLAITILVILELSPIRDPLTRLILSAYGVLGCLYLGFYYYFYRTSPNKNFFAWFNAIVSGLALGALIYFVPPDFQGLLYTLIFIGALTTSIISTRAPAYFFVACIALFHFINYWLNPIRLDEWVTHLGLFLSALIVAEIIQQVKSLTQSQIKRLEILNEVSQRIVSTLNQEQILTLLNAALQKVLEADSYYIGVLKGDEIHMQLFYDEGEYFNNVKIKKEGSLSGRIVETQEKLFIPDLQVENLKKRGLNFKLIGTTKLSRSWVGVPMRGGHINGVIAIGSYQPNRFDQSDLELLSNIAQRAALALDNAYHHERVQEEARLDSLTRVYNHGYFIKSLQEQAEACKLNGQPLSLIMLDIDHFKRYNDSYGHQVGDQVLINLCRFIRENIKASDLVGRWGGEEFSVALPNANLDQALQVARRIQSAMLNFTLKLPDEKEIPAPTVSQGIALYPEESQHTVKLIDLADKRLYIAKERGRNQIEAILNPPD
ncbi:MAG: diguanylate cyclase [Anaerolineales bacterium]|nr:diguanylate cyclase [Anaerolineales bacterium]